MRIVIIKLRRNVNTYYVIITVSVWNIVYLPEKYREISRLSLSNQIIQYPFNPLLKKSNYVSKLETM